MENAEEDKKRQPRKAVYAVQVGQAGFRVEKTTNYLDVRCGTMLSKTDAEDLISKGVNFTVARNK